MLITRQKPNLTLERACGVLFPDSYGFIAAAGSEYSWNAIDPGSRFPSNAPNLVGVAFEPLNLSQFKILVPEIHSKNGGAVVANLCVAQLSGGIDRSDSTRAAVIGRGFRGPRSCSTIIFGFLFGWCEEELQLVESVFKAYNKLIIHAAVFNTFLFYNLFSSLTFGFGQECVFKKSRYYFEKLAGSIYTLFGWLLRIIL